MSSRWRPDIQALRGIAISLVVIFHYYPSLLPGGYVGVDVFFVISGYLISLHILQRADGSFWKQIVSFFTKRVLRLAPLGIFVLFVILLLTIFFVPGPEKNSNFTQIVTSSFAIENWALAFNSVDYVHQSDTPTLTQHFWSLSIEEQFYIFWAIFLLLMLSGNLWRKKNRLNIRLFSLTAVIVLLSFMISIAWTQWQQDSAYFSTFTRIWEFGVGALWAIAVVSFDKFPAFIEKKFLKNFILIVSLAAIIGSALLFNADSSFPGIIALLPVAGAIGVIVVGSKRESDKFWSHKTLSPIRGLGNISYGLYLWHWPILICSIYVFGNSLSDISKLGLITISILCSILSWIFIEKKFISIRTQKTKIKILGALASMVVLLFFFSSVAYSLTQIFQQNESELSAASQSCLGANSLINSECLNPFDSRLLIDPGQAATDYAQNTFDDCSSGLEIGRLSDVPICEYGNQNSPNSLVLVGDSHAGQWLPALIEVSKTNDLKVIAAVRSSCYFSNSPPYVPGDVEGACQIWQKQALQFILDQSPTYVVIAGLSPFGYEFGKAYLPDYSVMKAGYTSVISQIVNNGSKVLIIKDTPYMEESIPSCLAQNSNKLDCRKERKSVLDSHRDLLAEAGAEINGVTVVDLNNNICDDEYCYAVVGGLIVFRDHQHLTKTYVETLSSQLGVIIK